MVDQQRPRLSPELEAKRDALTALIAQIRSGDAKLPDELLGPEHAQGNPTLIMGQRWIPIAFDSDKKVMSVDTVKAAQAVAAVKAAGKAEQVLTKPDVITKKV